MLGLNTAGYDLYEVSNNEWVLECKNGTKYEGTFAKVIRVAILTLDFNADDIDSAVVAMLEKGHDAIHFGMYKKWIFTFSKEVRHVGHKAS